MRFFTLVLALDVLTAIFLSQLDESRQVYLRNIVFSTIVADREVANEAELEQRLADGFRDEPAPQDLAKYLDADKLRRLRGVAAAVATSSDDDALAVAVTRELGQRSDGTICGIESLGRVVRDTARGLGCCSDFSKAWIFYARHLGLRTRESYTMVHTTVEYFDRRSGQWHMVDPLNHFQIVDERGVAQSQFSIRAQDLFSAFQIARQLPGDPGFDAPHYGGYAQAQYATLMWKRGINYLEIEYWDGHLRTLKLPKPARQLILLASGIQPGWLMLTTNTLAFYLRILQAILLASTALLLGVNALALWRLPQRFRRSKPVTAGSGAGAKSSA